MDKVKEFMRIMEENGDGGWPYDSAEGFIGNKSLEEAVAERLAELEVFNRGVQQAIDAGYDFEFLLRKPKNS